MPITECQNCGGSLHWHWEEAFAKFGFGDGDGQVGFLARTAENMH